MTNEHNLIVFSFATGTKMFALKAVKTISNLATPKCVPQLLICAGLKQFEAPPKYDVGEHPTKPKLSLLPKVPQYPNGVRAPKMQKRIALMRGPEPVHNFLIHKQYGVIATQGGRMKHNHFEMIRLSIGRAMDTSRMFAIWRIPAPWQPLTKKGIGVRMGSGKGSIDHYATPIRAGRVILEMAGQCEFEEVKKMLHHAAVNLPFKAMAVSQEMLDEMNEQEKKKEKINLNPYTKQFVIQNNLNGCHKWLKPIDHKYFGKYV